VHFAATTLEHLVDSPLYAGRHVRRMTLDPDPRAPVVLNAFADNEAELAANATQVALHGAFVRETLALFGGARHYRHYDFLVAIREPFDGIGIEHHQSSENRFAPGYFVDWTGPTAASRDLLPHEFVHSWNGKFRRPAELWTPSYEVPMRTSLLWVYEGLTEYWGVVLAARSGLWSVEFARDTLAHYAAAFDQGRAGRQWRSLQDTTRQPVIFYRGKQSYPSWQRGKDYYTEGLLLWLDVDTRIRELTRGRRSLDDFARAFFGVESGRVEPLTYTFEDVVHALNAVAPYDWATALRRLLDSHGPGAPLEGLTRAGWKLTYDSEPSASGKTIDAANGNDDFLYSLGLAVDKSGNVDEVYWDSAAFKAGIGRDMTVVAVNSRAYSAAGLREAVKAAHRDPAAGIELLVRDQDLYRTVRIDYHDGPKYPRLERGTDVPDRLGEILKPSTRKVSVKPVG
jgi:predicted metalloprotease with PDZ domain